ncbi:MAG: CAP domain-containing protein [Deinococcota bacterium]
MSQRFATIWKFIIYSLSTVILASCTQIDAPSTTLNATPTPSVLGIGTIDIGKDTGIQTSTLNNGFLDFPSELTFTASPLSQLTFDNVNGVSGRFLLTRVQVQNTSGRNLENVTFLGLSLAGSDQSLTAYSNVLTIQGNPVTDPNQLYQVKPSQPISINGITDASFVAFSEADLDAGFRQVINNIPGVNVAAILPYGFIVGDIAAGGDATLDLGFFIPDGNTIGRFSFRLVAVTDTIERFTQGINEVTTNGNTDTNYSDTAPVRQRYGTPSPNKKLVLIGPYTRNVSQADIDSNIFELLPDIRIAGTAGNALATLFDSGSTAVAQVQAAGGNTSGNITALSELMTASTEPNAGNSANVTYTWTVTGSGTCTLDPGYGQPVQNITPCSGNQTYTHIYPDWQNYYFAELTVTDTNGFNQARVHSFLPEPAFSILRQTNDVRSQARSCNGIATPAAPPLRWSNTLANLATGHSQDMATRNFFNHTNPDGDNWVDRIMAANYPNLAASGENISLRFDSLDYSLFLEQWLTSTSNHCDNIMSTNFEDFGFGSAQDDTPPANYPTSPAYYGTQKFAAQF